MKMRQLKHLKARLKTAIKIVANVVTRFPVYRKKDDTLIAVASSAEAATALVIKAKAAKKATLYVGKPYQTFGESQLRN